MRSKYSFYFDDKKRDYSKAGRVLYWVFDIGKKKKIGKHFRVSLKVFVWWNVYDNSKKGVNCFFHWVEKKKMGEKRDPRIR